MALSTEEAQELKSAFSLMSADELRGMKGDDADHDALIDQMLDTGKAVEVKGGAVVDGKPAEVLDAANGDDDDDEDDGATGFVDEHGRPVADPNAAPAEAEAPAAAAEAAPEAAPELVADAGEIAPLDLTFLDAHFREKQQALDAEKAIKFKALMDGEITPEEYSQAETDYLNGRDALQVDKRFSADWMTQVHAFKHKALADVGINYDTDKTKNESLDAWIKHLAQANPNKTADWYLQQAHKKVMIEFEVAPRAASAPAPQNSPKTPVAEKKVANKQGRAPDLSAIPPTIGTLPSATSIDGGDGGEFAHLDNLSGIEYERALARLSPDQKARYEAM